MILSFANAVLCLIFQYFISCFVLEAKPVVQYGIEVMRGRLCLVPNIKRKGFSLLSLGVKKIHLGPTLPAFLSPNIVDFLVQTFEIGGISSVEEDLVKFFE